MTAIPMPEPITTPWTLPRRGPVGMLLFIVAETSIFGVFVTTYLFYIGRSLTGPTPAEVLHFPVAMTVSLLSSSLTIHQANRALRRGATARFLGFWLATILLGAGFLLGTAREWHELIFEHHLTLRTNLFGSTYYALVGLHAFHVTVGLACLSLVSALAFLGHVKPAHAERGDVLSLYWHFVDGVWVVVFMVVYVIAR